PSICYIEYYDDLIALLPFPTRRSSDLRDDAAEMQPSALDQQRHGRDRIELGGGREIEAGRITPRAANEIIEQEIGDIDQHQAGEDRKSTRLNSSHVSISYAVFCLKKKN